MNCSISRTNKCLPPTRVSIQTLAKPCTFPPSWPGREEEMQHGHHGDTEAVLPIARTTS